MHRFYEYTGERHVNHTNLVFSADDVELTIKLLSQLKVIIIIITAENLQNAERSFTNLVVKTVKWLYCAYSSVPDGLGSFIIIAVPKSYKKKSYVFKDYKPV